MMYLEINWTLNDLKTVDTLKKPTNQPNKQN